MLLGRGTECAQVDRALAGAREGRSRVLVVRGPVGIGKSALLDYAVDQADGMAKLGARGFESESELSFSGLADLLEPALGHLPSIPARQATALASALAFGPPAPVDRLAVSAATLSLLAILAGEAPVIAVIEDAQWLDGCSLDALIFAARRVRSPGIAVFFAVREGEEDPLRRTDLPELRLRGLEREPARQLLADRTAVSSCDSAAPDLVARTAGNPRWLLQLPELLSPRQLDGAEPLPEPLPVGRSIELAYRPRVRALPAPTRAALLVAAASRSREVHPIRTALARIGCDLRSLAPAEWAGFLEIEGGELRFSDPMLRSAVYHGASPPQRRAAHRALERLDAGASASVLPKRAPAPSGNGRTLEGDDARGPDLRRSPARPPAEGDPDVARAVAEAARTETADPATAARMLVDAVAAACLTGAADVAVSTATRARRVADRAGNQEIRWLTDAVVAQALTFAGQERRSSRPRRRPGPPLGRVQGVSPAVAVLLLSVTGLVVLQDDARARSFTAGAIERARTGDPAGALPFLLWGRAVLGFFAGDWAAAEADAREAVRLARERHQAGPAAMALALLARLAAARGQEDDCRRHAKEALVRRDPHAEGCVQDHVSSALGLLELGLGRPERAIERLRSISPSAGCGAVGDLPLILWVPDLIEALARAGRPQEARKPLAILERDAAHAGCPWAVPVVERCRGLLAGDERSHREVARTVVWPETAPNPFERARTSLCHGERLRRVGRRVDSRDQLADALALFRRLEAWPWAERAGVELSATCRHLRRVVLPDQLTAQERQVAVRVARGASNREAATELFLSQKTIEFHLGNVYRKLGVHSRMRLAELVVQGDDRIFTP